MMKALPSRAKLAYLILFLAMAHVTLFSQGTPFTEGPLSVTIPPGWTGKLNFPGERNRWFSPESTNAQFFSVSVASSQTTDDLVTHHNWMVNNLSSIMAPGTTPQTGILGQFLWTRIVVIRPIAGSKPETMILYSAKAGSSFLAIYVDATTEDLLTKNLPAVEAMVRSAVIHNAAGAPAAGAAPQYPNASPNGQASADNRSGQQAMGAPGGSPTGQMPTGTASLNEYVYSLPPGWTSRQYPTSLTLFSPVSSTQEQCQITMWPMRPTSGDLLKDAASAFQQIYNGWEPRSQTSYGPLEASLVRGNSGVGWTYAMIKQGVGRHGPYESLMATVMAAKLNNSVAIVSTLAKDPLVSTCLGQVKDAWPDFFYSLGFKSWAPPTDQATAMKQALAGTWTIATSTAADQFTFTANGRYGGASAAQHYNLAGNDTVVATTQAFFGDGAYSLQGNTINFIPDDRNRPRNSGRLRMEQESTDGGRTWKPFLYLLRISSVDGKEYEVRYHRTGN